MSRSKRSLAAFLASTLLGSSLPLTAVAQNVRLAQPAMTRTPAMTGLPPSSQLPLAVNISAAISQPAPSLSIPQAPSALAPLKPAAAAKTHARPAATAAQTKTVQQAAGNALFDGSKARRESDLGVDSVAASARTSTAGKLVPSSGAAAGREALRKWMLKSVLQFGFERNPAEINQVIERLSAPKDSQTFKISPTETLTTSSNGKKLSLEFIRDNGATHKPTIIRGSYDGSAEYSLTLQFPQMSHALVMTHDRKATNDPAARSLSDADFAARLTRQEGLEDIDALARRQLSRPDFKAWEQLKDKNGQYFRFSPRATLLSEITSAELYHLLEWDGFKERQPQQGKVRLDIVYGYLGDEKLGEAEPLDVEQAHDVVKQLLKKGYTQAGEVLTKEFTYKGKPVTIEVRVTPSAVSNIPLTDSISNLLQRAGIKSGPNIIRNILKKGQAKSSMFPAAAPAQWLTETINGEIEKFQRVQMSSSFKAKKAFEESLAKGDVVVYDGHSGAGYGFRFGPTNIFLDGAFSFKFGSFRLYVHEQIKKITKLPWLRWLLRKLSWDKDGYFYLRLFKIPFLSGQAMHEQLIDPLRQRQLLFFDSCRSLLHYDELWRSLLRAHQRLMKPEQFDLIGTENDSDMADGVRAKLGMVEAVEQAMNAKQIVDRLHAGAVNGTKYAPGKLMGVADGTYEDIFGNPENKAHTSQSPNTDTPGFILDNNGAQVSFLKPGDKQQPFPDGHKTKGASK